MHRHATWVSHRTPKINYMDRRGQHSPRAHKSTKRGRVAAAAPRCETVGAGDAPTERHLLHALPNY